MNNNEARWGILGTSSISERVIRGIREGGCGSIVAVGGRNIDRATVYAARHGIPKVFGSYAELLSSGEANLIYNPLPNSLHAEWTIKALETGHHVLCEKPFASNAKEALEVAAAAAGCGRHVSEALMYRHHPQWELVLGLLKNGAIGELASLMSRFTFYNDDPSSISASKELAGGSLMDVGCYCVNFSRLMTGGEPFRVSAFERRGEVDEMMSGLMEFPNGVIAQFECGIACFERHTAELTGTRGMIIVEGPWLPGDGAATVRAITGDGQTKLLQATPADEYLLEVREFVEVCTGKAVPRWPVSDAVANMKVIDALYRSAREGAAVNL